MILSESVWYKKVVQTEGFFLHSLSISPGSNTFSDLIKSWNHTKSLYKEDDLRKIFKIETTKLLYNIYKSWAC